MSDATTLPTLRDFSEAHTSAGHRSDSITDNGECDISSARPSSSSTKEEGSGEGEGKTDTKQKRKRTSQKDQSTLEAEYKVNPKPNKAARAEIVDKVDLNEKEVQIWFQNRRQIQRRKQRPLLPHEIAAYGLRDSASFSSDLTPAPILSSSQSIEESSGSSQDVAQEQETVTSVTQLPTELPAPPQPEEHFPTTNVLESSSLPLSGPLLRREIAEISSVDNSSFTADSVSKSFTSAPGYLANRWNAANSSFSTPTTTQTTQSITPTISNPTQPSSCPERIGFSAISPPVSKIRLSMSIDGKAELILSEPSPPRLHVPRPLSSGSILPHDRARGLHRSQSAVAFGSQSVIAFGPRLSRGRSRDARSWQLACDPEARDELTMQAENESSGSAVAAISLLRSTSKSVLKSNTNKRNATAAKHDIGVFGKKPKLGRVQSSLARLQGRESDPKSQSSKGKADVLHSPSGDSDKENMIPLEGGGNARRRPLPTGLPEKRSSEKSVLGDIFNPHQHSTRLGSGQNRRRKAANSIPKIFEDQDNGGEVGEEVEKFMRGEVSPSKRGEFEGAQALLAMMGSWR